MDFGSLPPEINSARMYTGPGSGSMLAAAAAWDMLSAELHATAAACQSVTSDLASGPWLGNASMLMLNAVTPFVAWLQTTASQAEESATQARAAASAYDAARAMMVPPPVVAANRAQLMSLTATNLLGQNTPAIAATEAHYGQMWAQDAVAMYGYAGASAAAATVTAFTPPPAIARSRGVGAQEIVASGSRLISALPQALRRLALPASPASSAASLGAVSSYSPTLETLMDHANSLSGHTRTVMSALSSITAAARLAPGAGAAGTGAAAGAGIAAGAGVAASAPIVETGAAALASSASPALVGDGAVSPALGRAASVGTLPVPQAWPAAAPAAGPVGAALPDTRWHAGPAGGQVGAPVVPIAGMTGHGGGRLAAASRLGHRTNLLPRSPVGG